jgi:hypothetical protein
MQTDLDMGYLSHHEPLELIVCYRPRLFQNPGVDHDAGGNPLRREEVKEEGRWRRALGFR